MIPQLLANILISTASYMLVAVGFSLIFQVTRIFHFAHAAVFTAAAYVALVAAPFLDGHVIFTITVAVGFAVVLGASIELVVYQPLHRRRSPNNLFLLASLGIYVVIQNLLSLLFGDSVRTLDLARLDWSISFADARLTGAQVALLGAAPIAVLLVLATLRGTKLGLAARAVADDEELAGVFGMNVAAVRLAALAVGSALAGLGGVFAALDSSLFPTMGFAPLLIGATAAIVGGIGSVVGAVVGSVIIGIVVQVSVIVLPSQWQQSLVFGVLLLFLLLRPRGLVGPSAPRLEA